MTKIAIIGLGYVGMPLAAAFSSKFQVFGFDRTLELDENAMKKVLYSGMSFSTELDSIKEANFFIVTVPTPIDEHKNPDLSPLKGASTSVAKVLKKGDIVVFESTVYPGASEEFCVPILESVSGLRLGVDFEIGYSPERINPGDKEHTVTKITKIVSGSSPKALKTIKEVYSSVIEAGIFEASSIRVAEAAKVIENTQRDINIAFVNELKMIFDRMGIDTMEVLKAARTKWNFLPFEPGLVGGHCIGVDPYYLTHKAEAVGHNPEIILAGRRINDNMGAYHASQIVKKMIKNGLRIKDAKVLILGITFKQNCPDIRNSKVLDVIGELSEFGCAVSVCDPWARADEVKSFYNLELSTPKDASGYECVVLAVNHEQFRSFDFGSVLRYDIRSF